MVAVVVEQAAKPVFYSQFVGLIFNNQDGIAKNPAMVDHMNSLPEDSIDTTDGQTSFNVDSANLGYFMHMLFANMPEGFVLNTAFDGVHTFEAPDEQGQLVRFNAQLVTVSQIAAPLPT
jgi:hypothetical protein